MAMATRVPGGWTYGEYAKLDDGTRYEVIHGELRVTPAPTPLHQEVSGELYRRLAAFVEEHGAGKVLYAPVDVVLGEGETDVVQPDLLFVRTERLAVIGPLAVRGAPDLVVEILSPGSVRRDRYEKRDLYARVAVPEYWIVDPTDPSLEVLSLDEGAYRLHSAAEETGAVTSRVLEGLSVRVEEVIPGS